MFVLGIETSCDETAVAIVDDKKKILAHQLVSQIDDHALYGGVVPEIAARAHLSLLPQLLIQALNQADLNWTQCDGIAATAGPGLIGGVMIGVMMAKAIAMAHNKPFIAVNHLAAHALTVRLTSTIEFPYLTLLVSGGHCQLIYVKSASGFTVLGSTLDDAVGECFDKTARLLGLSYPGGAEIEKLALKGNPDAFNFPIPFKGRTHENEAYQFSFSGLKSAVKRVINQHQPLDDKMKSDIAASLQYTITAALKDRTENALKYCLKENLIVNGLVLCGGVAANNYLRTSLENLTQNYNTKFYAPPPDLCTDNGVMVAWCGLELLKAGLTHPLSFKPIPRWPLQKGINYA